MPSQSLPSQSLPSQSLPAQTLPAQTLSNPAIPPQSALGKFAIDPLPPPPDRHLLTQVAGQSLSFPMQWVTDIIQVDRTQILPLPLYPAALWGMVHYQSTLVPLVLSQPTTPNSPWSAPRAAPATPIVLAVRLSKALGKLAGVGIVIDRVLGSTTSDLLPPQSCFQPSDLPAEIWQPCWDHPA